MRRRHLLLGALLVVLFPVGVVAEAQIGNGEHVACVTVAATAQTPSHEVGVDGSPVHTIPGDTDVATDSACVTATDQTVTTTLPGSTVTVTAPTTTAPPPTTTEPPPPTWDLDLRNTRLNCLTAIDYDRVRIIMDRVSPTASVADALRFGPGCTGRIGFVYIETSQADGIKVSRTADGSPFPHDIVVESGIIICHGPSNTNVHQDGVQVMGGQRITFRNMDMRCDGDGNAQFFVQDADGVPAGGCQATSTTCPQHILLDGGILRSEGNLDGSPATQKSTSLRIEESYASGARNTLICPGKWFWSFYESGATAAIGSTTGADRATLDGNQLLPKSSPICTGQPGE